MGDPKMMYVVVSAHGPVFANDSYERCLERISTLLKHAANDPNAIPGDYQYFTVMKVEAE